jgi:hypothetical protein
MTSAELRNITPVLVAVSFLRSKQESCNWQKLQAVGSSEQDLYQALQQLFQRNDR